MGREAFCLLRPAGFAVSLCTGVSSIQPERETRLRSRDFLRRVEAEEGRLGGRSRKGGNVAEMEEVQIRTSRRLGVFSLAASGLGAAVILAVEFMRIPLLIVAVLALMFSAILLLVDRRVKLAFSDAGMRYSRWRPSVVPWHEFAGYRWVKWRHQPHLRLLPRRPSELVAGFSPYGKFNHFCYGLLRMPPFSIAASQLEVHDSRLEELVARYLPEQPAG